MVWRVRPQPRSGLLGPRREVLALYGLPHGAKSMKISYIEESGGHDDRIEFRIGKEELYSLPEEARMRVAALLQRGQFEDVIEALTIIEVGRGGTIDMDFDTIFRDIHAGAEDLWERLHKQYGDTNPFESPYSGQQAYAQARHHQAGARCYVILGVPPSASKAEIKLAFRKLAKEHHPDRGGDPKKFQEIQEAYEEAIK